MADTTNGTVAESLAPSTITRSVWDGNTLVAEFQGIGTFAQSHGTLEIDGTGSSPVSNQQPYGSIIYVEGGLDAPLAFRRTVSSSDHVIVPHTNYRGLYDDGTTSSGAAADVDIVWPGNNRRTYGELITTMTGVGWAGSIVPDYQGESGLQYKRNRYYDPATGKFTQLDPIGLGGGSNLYEYADGDPINTTDPFGLCPKNAGGDGATETAADCSRDVLDSWAAEHVTVNSNTDWKGVNPTLRDAVVRGSIDLDEDLYVSAGMEGGHASRSFHALGLAVDISRVNGMKFLEMSDPAGIGGALANAITAYIPETRWAEVFSPAGIHRYNWAGQYTAAQLMTLQRAHQTHVHISILP